MMMTSKKQNDDDVINFFHEFEVNMIDMILQSTLSKMDTFVTPKSVRLIEASVL